MKRSLTVALFLLTFSVQAFAHGALSRGTNPLLRFVARIRVLREFALYTLIEERCNRYMKPSEIDSCDEAIDQKITLLDFDILLGEDKKTPVLLNENDMDSFVFVAFKKDLIRLLSDYQTQKYLELVNSEMTKFLTGQKKVTPNLWDLSRNFYGNDFDAARALAVLFQDTSSVKLHLAYLEMSGVQGTTNQFDPNRELLGRTIDTMNMVLDANGENFQALFYPPAVQAKLHRTIYHFYVPTYLTMALKKKGVPERFAMIAPMMLTVTYEFVTSAPDYRYLFDDPEKLGYTSREDEWTVGDIYASYSGVSFAINALSRAVTLEDLRRAFNASTASGVALLTK